MSWPRDAFAAAVWESQTLKPLERLVALAYADHARDAEVSWVAYPRMQERTDLSRDAITRALKGLREQGWLLVEEPSRQQRATRYRMHVAHPDSDACPLPRGGLAGACPLSHRGQEEASPLSPDTSPLSPDTSPLPDGPDYSTHHSSHQTSDDESQRQAVAALLARFPGQLAEEKAVAAVAAMLAWSDSKPEPVLHDIVKYAGSRTLAEIRSWASGRRAKVEPTPRITAPRHDAASACKTCGAPNEQTCHARQAIADDGHDYAPRARPDIRVEVSPSVGAPAEARAAS